MTTSSFHEDTKFCPCCNDYVRYLASVERSYCVECGSEVRLFSESDWAQFEEGMEARRNKGGRPRGRTATRAKAQPRRASA
ncbi:MAG: hypothetical protein AAF726_12275 [Planctomycetota bacterium]